MERLFVGLSNVLQTGPLRSVGYESAEGEPGGWLELARLVSTPARGS